MRLRAKILDITNLQLEQLKLRIETTISNNKNAAVAADSVVIQVIDGETRKKLEGLEGNT